MSNKQYKSILAVDVMGADNHCSILLNAVYDFLNNDSNKDTLIKVYGKISEMQESISQLKLDQFENFEVLDSESSIRATDSPTKSLRSAKGSSMYNAIQSVANNEADAVISAGNTGMLMALSKIIIKMMSNFHRPAIATVFPGQTVMLDLGANSSCSSSDLHQFGIMGSLFHTAVFNSENPTVALLNIGSEAHKGDDVIKDADRRLSEDNSLNYTGFIEGNQILFSQSNVIVTDGFTGNISLKTMEGAIKYLTKKIKSSTAIKVTYFALWPFSSFLLNKIKNSSLIDYREYNGAMLLGLNGIVVKSHGNTDRYGFYSSLVTAKKIAESNIKQKLINVTT